MKIKFLIFSLFVVIALFLGCIESKKLPAVNVTKTTTPKPVASITEKLPADNETKPLTINDTFETWSRGYWSNLSYKQTYFRVITNYTQWGAFLDDQGYYIGPKGERTNRLEGQLFPGLGVMPKTIASADFNNYFIIAAMMGYKTHVSPEIEIQNINRYNNIVNVTVRMYNPSFGGQVVSAPYHIVIVKREMLPIGNSTFVFYGQRRQEAWKSGDRTASGDANTSTHNNETDNSSIYIRDHRGDTDSHAQNTCVRSNFGNCGLGSSAININ